VAYDGSVDNGLSLVMMMFMPKSFRFIVDVAKPRLDPSVNDKLASSYMGLILKAVLSVQCSTSAASKGPQPVSYFRVFDPFVPYKL
jgi:hypothetical protein